MPVSSRQQLILVALLAFALLGLVAWSGNHWARVWYHEQAARTALEQRDFATAAEQLRHCLRLQPGQANLLLLAAQTARRAGEFDRAEKLLQDAATAGEIPEIIALERRLQRFQSGELTDAEAHWNFCREHPEHVSTPLILEALIVGSLQVLQLDLARRGIALWLEQRSSPIEQSQGLFWRGQLAVRQGNGEGALADYRLALEKNPANEAAQRQAVEILVRYDAPEALRLLEPLLQKRPKDAALQLLLARCRRRLGEPESARSLLDALLADRPNEPQVLLERGLVELDLGQPAQAEPWLRRAIAVAPQMRDLNAALAQCLRLLGHPEAAEFEERTRRLDADIQAKIDRVFGTSGGAK